MKKIEITKQKLIIAIMSAVFILAIGAYLIFFAPLAKELKIKYLECRSREYDVIKCRQAIESAGLIYKERELMTEKEIAQAINGLTKFGKSKGVNFVFINPGEIEAMAGSPYKILPIKMRIMSSYSRLGIFLGSLDDLEKGVVKVRDFDVSLDDKNPEFLLTDLTADVYLSGR